MDKKFKLTHTVKKFKVNYIESERGWGQKIDETEEFDTYEKAMKAIKKYNAKNDQTEVPDWYMYAEPANFSIKQEDT